MRYRLTMPKAPPGVRRRPTTARRSLTLVWWGACWLATAAAPGSAQQRCRYSVPPSGYTQTTQSGAGLVHYVSGGIDYQCPDGARILADSAVVFQTENRAELFGDVRFSDPTTELVSRRAFYYGNNRQLNAWDDIRLVDQQNGAVITGDQLVLYRAAPGRPLDRMIITGQAPHATVFLSEGGIESVIPYEVDARRFTLEGRRHFRAGGDVVVDRATLHAVGDSLDFDQELGVMSVIDNARVRDVNFDLVARTVTVLTPNGLVEEVLAREDAELVGDDLALEAPAIRMFVDQNQVQRLVALRRVPPLPTGLEPPDADEMAETVPPGEQAAEDRESLEDPGLDSLAAEADAPARPSAVAQEFHLWADSIDIRSPGQVLDRVIAVGSARSESVTEEDSIPPGLPEVAREDWMEGDTIVAQFAAISVPPEEVSDTSGAEVDIETVTASGQARSLYKLAPSDPSGVPTGGPPALHYVRADVIRIHFRAREVVRIEVHGQTTGYHFEPTPTPPRPDTAAVAPADTTGGGRAPVMRGGPARSQSPPGIPDVP